MEEKMNRVRDAVLQNPNLSTEFKNNLVTLTNAMISVLPEYDYSYFEKFLSSLKVSDNSQISGHSMYDLGSNELSLNLEYIAQNGIDIQHLFMQKLLSIGTHKEEKDLSVKGFYDGVAEDISLLMNADEGLKSSHPLEHLSIMQLLHILDPKVMIDAYMTDDLSIVLENLERYGITKEELIALINEISQISAPKENNQAFLNSQKIMIDMFGKMIQTRIRSGVEPSQIDSEYSRFDEVLIASKAELRSMYPLHTFSNMGDISSIKTYASSSKEQIKNELNQISAPYK